MKAKIIGLTGSIGTAILASSCCTVPLILAFLGLSSLGAVSFMTRYRLILFSVPFIFLGVAYYFTYRKKNESSEASCCPEKLSTKNKASKIILWVVTGVIGGLTVFAYLKTSTALQKSDECCAVEQGLK